MKGVPMLTSDAVSQLNNDRKQSKKYTLFSMSRLQDPSVKPLCAFFQSAAGCRNGSSCKFAHINTVEEKNTNCYPSNVAAAPAPPPPPSQNRSSLTNNNMITKTSGASTSASSISSESSDSISCKERSVQESNTMGKKGGKKRKSAVDAPQQQPSSTTALKEEQKLAGGPLQKKSKNKNASHVSNNNSSDENPFDLGPVSTASKPNKTLDERNFVTDEDQQPPPDFKSCVAKLKMPITPPVTNTASTNITKLKKEQKKQQGQQQQQQTDFRSFASTLPVAAFSAQASQEKDVAPEDSDELDEEGSIEEAMEKNNINDVNIVKDEEILPTSHADGKKWKDLVVKTRSHPRYINLGRVANQAEGWFKARRYGSWCAKFPQVIAIDCEMCETKDPQTGKVDGKALCRISVVNGLDPSDILLDTLVKPEWPVTNHRTWINGIDKSHLGNVQFTLSHAQEFMKALCSDETVMIGHALHNDLEAIKMEHHCLVDSSFLFPVKDSEGKNFVCSLRDLAKQFLHKEMPSTHDSVNDARTALEAVQLYLEKDGKVDPIVRTAKNGDALKLLVHRIPKGAVSESHIENMFLHLTRIKPLSVEEIQYSGGYGKTYAVFDSPDHANLSFRTLHGEQEVDKGNYLQKKVFLKSKDYVRVRKMVPSKRRAG
jgi:RNA exonuclease 1